MLKFIKYLFSYKANTMKIYKLEAENETLKSEATWYESKAENKNKALREIHNLIADYEKGGPIRTKLYKDIKIIVDNNVERKLSDDILGKHVK